MQKTLTSQQNKLFLRLLRKARHNAGVTQTELAKRISTTQSFVSKCERGERRLDAVELRVWCKALGVSFQAFVRAFDRASNNVS